MYILGCGRLFPGLFRRLGASRREARLEDVGASADAYRARCLANDMRLERRGEDAPDVIELRLKNAAVEMAQASKFDFVIINELFERALFDMKAVVHAQRLKYAAQRRARADTFHSLNIA